MSRTLAICAVLSATAQALAADWPQFRGPGRDDISGDTGLLERWSKDGPPMAWKTKGIGGGYSGVSVAGDRVYTMGEKGDSSYTFALGRGDGRILWSTKIGRSGAPGWGGFAGPRCTPTVDGDRIFALGHYGELVCLEAATGKVVWTKDYKVDLGGPLPEWGFSESVLVDGDAVVCTPGGPKGTVCALDKRTGEVIWRSTDVKDTAAYASLIAVDHLGVRQYIVLTPERVAGFEAKTGRTLWKADRKGQVAVIPTPIFHDGLLYVSSGYGVGCNLFKILQVDGTNGFAAEPVWDNKVMVNHHGGVVLVGKHLYGHSDGKGWVCQDLETGKMVWNEKEKFGKGSLTFADGRLYLRQEDGEGPIALIEATTDGYRETGRFEQPERSDKNSWPHPVVVGGKLYIRDQDVLLCYDVKKR